MWTLARFSARHPIPCLAGIALATLAGLSALPRLELRTEGEALVPLGDPIIERTDRDRAIFGDGEEVMALVSASADAPLLTSTEGLRRLRSLHLSLARLPIVVPSSIQSAATLVDPASSTFGRLGTWLAEPPSDNPARVAARVERLFEQPSTAGLRLAEDGRTATILASLTPDSDRPERRARLEEWARGQSDGRYTIRVTGPAPAAAWLGDQVIRDLRLLVPVMVLVIAVLLFLCLRNLGGVILVLTKVGVVLVWTGALMAWAEVPLTLVTTVLPILLTALATTDEIHVLAELRARLRGRRSDVAGAVVETLAHLRKPILTTSLSTAIGFLSFSAATIPPIRHFGLFAAVGIVSATFLTFALTPALAIVLPAGLFRPDSEESRLSTRAPKPSGGHRVPALFGLLLVAVALPGLLRVSVEDSWVDNLDPTSELAQAYHRLDSVFWGAHRIDVVLRAESGLLDPGGRLRQIAELEREILALPRVAGVLSLRQPLDRTAEILGLDAPADRLPPEVLRSVIQVAETEPSVTRLDLFLDPKAETTRLMAWVPAASYEITRRLDQQIQDLLAERFAHSDLRAHTSGEIPRSIATVEAVVHSQLLSTSTTLFGIGLFLLVLDRRPRFLVAQLAPPTAAALWVWGLMGYAGWPLGVATSLFTASMLGVGIDLALHLTAAFDRFRSRGLEPEAAVEAALAETSNGRRWSTLVLTIGFLVLTASNLAPNHDLGLLLAAMMVGSFAATRLFVPYWLTR